MALSEVVPSGEVSVPVKYQFAGITAVQSGNSFKEWMSKYPEPQRRLVEAFAGKFRGIYNIKSEAQVGWMAQKGYLMPEDVIAAYAMSDAQLKQLADGGNIKAGLFYNQRMQEQYDQARVAYVTRGGDARRFSESEEGKPYFMALLISNRVLSADTENPFMGYQMAWKAFSSPDPGGVSAGLVEGLLQANLAGDIRTTRILEEYVRQGLLNDSQATVAVAALTAAKSYIGTMPYECRARPYMPGVL